MAQSDINDRNTTQSTYATPDRARGNALDYISMLLMIIGGLNWGLVGLFDVDLVAALFGQGSMISRVVYVLVGLAAVWGIVTMTKLGKR